MDALPIALPATGGFVQAAVPGDAVAGAVLHDAGLLMKEGLVLNRLALVVTRHGHLHLQMAAADHPGQQFQRALGLRIRRRQGQRSQALLHLFAQRLAAFDGLDFAGFQGTPNQKPHDAAVAHQSFDAPRRKSQGVGVEVAGEPVVAFGVLQRRNVEQLDQIAVFRRVAELPGAVTQHRTLRMGPLPAFMSWRSRQARLISMVLQSASFAPSPCPSQILSCSG